MFYTFTYTVTTNDIVTAKHRIDMELSAGVIHQVDILFQKDAAHKINVQIFHGGHQVWPTNPGGSIKADATVISFREFYELRAARNDLFYLIWTSDIAVLKEVVVNIGILPKRIIQPLSFDELLSAAAGF